MASRGRGLVKSLSRMVMTSPEPEAESDGLTPEVRKIRVGIIAEKDIEEMFGEVH